MNRFYLACCGLFLLIVIGSTGCKKDEEESSSAPEKVSEPEIKTKTAALSEKTDKEPADRVLKVKKAVAKTPKKKRKTGKDKGTTKAEATKAQRGAPLPKAKNQKKAQKQSNEARKPRVAAKPGGAPPTKPTMRPGARPPVADDRLEDEYDAPGEGMDTPTARKPRSGPRADRPERNAGRGGPSAAERDPVSPARANTEDGRTPSSRFRNDRRTPMAAAPPASRSSDKKRTAGLPTRVRPNAEQLLRKEDLKTLLKLKKAVDVHELSGLPSDHQYDGIYWGSPDGAKYYVGLQLWKMRSPIEAQRQYTQMVRSYPNAEETTAVTSKTFLAFWNELIYLVYLDTTKQSVVAVTCHEKVCTQPSMLVGIAQTSRERL